MVQLCLNKFLPALQNSREETFNMLTVLRESTEGKMILEREYAATTK
jgi:hypothetical protein